MTSSGTRTGGAGRCRRPLCARLVIHTTSAAAVLFCSFNIQNSVRHNLSLHKMFIRKMSPDGKVSFWTVRPEANRGLTLDQVYTVRHTFERSAFHSVDLFFFFLTKALMFLSQPGCNPVAAPVARPVPASPRQVRFPPSSERTKFKPSFAIYDLTFLGFT